MDQLAKIDIAKCIENVRLYYTENPLQSGLLALATLGSAYFLFGGKSKLKVEPSRCIVVITGCDSGFGRMTCEKLSSMGYLVVAGCLQARSVVELESTVALAVQCDITKEADLHLLVTKVEALAKNRGARLWAVMNNAGVANSGNLDLVSSKACRQVMEVNFFALFEVTRSFLPLLKQTKDSRVINVSSAAGFVGSYQMGVYCASKHAVEGLGKVLRQELAPWNIHVAHINPGFMNTPILQAAFDSSIADLAGASPEVVAQYDLSAVNKLRDMIDRLKDDPRKVVDKIVENLTLAKPAFNNPVGRGVYTLWCLLSFVPQRLVWAVTEWGNRQQGFGPTPEALQGIQRRQ